MTRGVSGGKIAVPRHPAVAYGVVVSLLVAVVAAVSLTAGDGPALFPALLAALLLLVLSLPWLHALRVARPVQHNNSAVNAMFAGRFDEAEQHLIEAERSNAPMLRITTKIVRAQLCVQRAELNEALQHLDAALAARLPWFGRSYTKLANASARGIRAFVRALRDDQAGARADLAALEHLPLSSLVWGDLRCVTPSRDSEEFARLAHVIARYRMALHVHAWGVLLAWPT